MSKSMVIIVIIIVMTGMMMMMAIFVKMMVRTSTEIIPFIKIKAGGKALMRIMKT